LNTLDLQCAACDISDLDQSGIRHSGISTLRISGFKDIPSELLRLIPAELEELEIDLAPALDLQKLVEELKDRKRLKKLSLHQMNLKKLPEGMDELTALRELDLNQNRNFDLASLADFPETCQRLEKLSLSNLHPPADPKAAETLYQLPHLQMPALLELSIGWTKFTRMDFRLLRAPQLTRLDLQGNHLEEFPKGLRRYKNLQSLNLFGNDLRLVPDYLKKRPLQYLNLSMNRHLPPMESIKLLSWDINELHLPEIEEWD
jgi:Leucine-rich repeat (LRR) protein